MNATGLASALIEAKISFPLVIVLAVITTGVGALAYGWCHAQAATAHQRSLVTHHHVRYVAIPDATH
jgi:hypothetical protein